MPLQHSQGRLALDRGEVDAWAGLDPFMAEAELQGHDVLFYRNPRYVSPGTLVVREDALAASPGVVTGVLAAYETARAWATAHPDALAALVASAARLPVPVAARQLSRTAFPPLDVTASQRERVGSAISVLVASGSVSTGGDPARAFATLFTPSLAPVATR